MSLGTDVLWSRLSQAADTTSDLEAAFDTSWCRYLRADFTVSVLTGGTAPTIQFVIEAQGADGAWYAVWSGTAIAAPGAQSVNIGPDVAGSNAANAVLTGRARLRTVWAGTAPPTSVTWTGSIIGKGM